MNRSRDRFKGTRGAILVEFAFIALILYLLFAATVESGRLIFSAQTLQDAARIGARELARTPLAPGLTFEQALQDPTVQARIYNPAHLVIFPDLLPDVNGNGVTGDDLDAHFATLPVVNQMLRPAMIHETLLFGGNQFEVLRYPGALMIDAFNQLTVGIPKVTSRGVDGVEEITWIPVVEEIRVDPGDPTTGPFSISAPVPQAGLVALRINYPFQAASLSGFQDDPTPPADDELPPNLGHPILANDGGVVLTPGSPAAPGTYVGDLFDISHLPGTYSGSYGLGSQEAFAKQVRPWRKLLAAQAIFRREVFQ